MPRTTLHKISLMLGKLAGFAFACTLLLQPAHAAPPRTFSATYNASYEGISAGAQRSLTFDEDTNQYTLASTVELTLFGSSLTRIDERSDFLWVEEQPLPQHYEFVQTGFGARKRTIDFDHAKGIAKFTINDDRGELMLDGPAFDELSGYLVAKEQLTQGKAEARFDVVDRGEIREHHYRIVNRVMLQTPLGRIKAVHLERIRGEDSARKTEIWLAPDHDYLLLKLVQTEPDGDTIELAIRSATLGEHELSAATLEAASNRAQFSPDAAPVP
ncbi:MAG TPA: DUF3108 domain-containing protein [Pseudomonadales bacterium]